MEKVVVWKAVEHHGLEHLMVEEVQDRLYAHGDVISVENGAAFHLHYTVKCDNSFTVREVNMTLESDTPTGRLSLRSNRHGNWSGDRQTPLPELDGCIDIDISATPFTNTLPIRRIQWQVGQSEEFRMVYILVPDLKVSVMRQRYTCLAKTDQGATFRYENVDDDFKADITVDSDGLVVHY